ncbi:hypothetical protein ACN27F_01170 [Solwaraspora sp. WMMB335]|uniref:hypothetical protein n=1 Tax=Solwaraspora sp. WMMB335 TaxID=3404118 RepID=UPI003B931922
MNSEFSDWPDDEFGDDADTADLTGQPESYPDPVEGFGPADPLPGVDGYDPVEEGFGPAPGDDDGFTGGLGGAEPTGDGTAGAGAPLGYGDDLYAGDEQPGDDDLYAGGGSAGDDAPVPTDGEPPLGEEGFGSAPPVAEEGFGAAEPPPGVDPDAPPGGDDWPEPSFPPPLDASGVPTPVDGWPWADADLLGDWSSDDGVATDAGPGVDVPTYGSVEAGELADYAGIGDRGADLWSALLGSDDPATSTLARFWSGR